MALKLKILDLLNSKGLTDSQRGLSFDNLKNEIDETLRDSTLHNLLLDMVRNNEIIRTGSGSHIRLTSVEFKEKAIDNAKRMKVP